MNINLCLEFTWIFFNRFFLGMLLCILRRVFRLEQSILVSNVYNYRVVQTFYSCGFVYMAGRKEFGGRWGLTVVVGFGFGFGGVSREEIVGTSGGDWTFDQIRLQNGWDIFKSFTILGRGQGYDWEGGFKIARGQLVLGSSYQEFFLFSSLFSLRWAQ